MKKQNWENRLGNRGFCRRYSRFSERRTVTFHNRSGKNIRYKVRADGVRTHTWIYNSITQETIHFNHLRGYTTSGRRWAMNDPHVATYDEDGY